MIKRASSLSSILYIALVISLIFFCFNLIAGSVVFATAGLYNTLLYSPQNQENLEVAAIVEQTLTAAASVEQEEVPTEDILPSATPTIEISSTPMAVEESNTPEPIVTDEEAAETEIPTEASTITNTIQPTATFTLQPTFTNTVQPPTNTPENRPSPTIDPTAQAAQFATFVTDTFYNVNSEIPPYSIILPTFQGRYYKLNDFNSSWSQTDSYQKTYTGFDFTNFVIRANASWEVAGNPSNAPNSGCGIIFHEDDNEDHYLVVFTIGDRAILYKRVSGSLANLGASYLYDVDPEYAQAEVMLVVYDNNIHIFVDGEEVYNKQQPSLETGHLAFTVLTATSQDFGTSCQLSDIEIWEVID